MKPLPEANPQALFLAWNAKRAAHDRCLNRTHERALTTLSRFLGDAVEFFNGQPVSRSVVPF
jgi:hypothetical protein